MDPRDPLLGRLRVTLTTLADRAEAHCIALFVPRQAGLYLLAQQEVNQVALDIAHSTWTRRRDELEAGMTVPRGKAVVWPLFDGPALAALLYIDNAPAGYPDDDTIQLANEMVRRLKRLMLPSPVTNYLTLGMNLGDARTETDRDQLAIALQMSEGKVRRAARMLGVTRETVYRRAERLGIDVDAFRRRRTSGR